VVLTVMLLTSAVVTFVGRPTSAGAATTPPVRAAFFYPWFPETEDWKTQYSPALGNYDSSNPTLLAAQMAQMKWAGLDAVISSWWRPGSPTDLRLSAVLDAAAGQGLQVSAYYEFEGEGDPTVDDIKADLSRLATLAAHDSWLRVGAKPVLFVYNANDTTCALVTKWRQATGTDWYLNLKVFDGYARCPDQPDSWHEYGPASALSNHAPYSMNVSPGFWKFDEPTPKLDRNLANWRADLSTMADADVPWKLLTSFNEWGEGTAIEPATQWQTPNGMGEYLTAAHQVFVEGKRFTGDPPTTTSTTPPRPAGAVVVAAAGDVSCETGSLDPASKCASTLTADTIVSMDPAAVLALGDLQYEKGTLASFRSRYDTSWGRFKAITYPAPGNHEWGTSNAQGYRDYFSTGVPAAVDVTRLYYSYDIGSWHFVSLDSDCKGAGGCEVDGEQTTWLAADLAANDGEPTLVYWHHPRFTSDRRGNNTDMSETWNTLVADRDVQLVLAGHTHMYERFAPMGTTGPDPAGLRQFIVGTGGRSHVCPPAAKHPGSEVTDCTTFGALQLTLNGDGSYAWRFVASAGTGSFADSGTQARR
jgi:Calcineurin-like phosphoesterase/Glycosyl hydrolase family 99